MYDLRRINNHYPGGTRTDYIIVGHPAYQAGRTGAQQQADGLKGYEVNKRPQIQPGPWKHAMKPWLPRARSSPQLQTGAVITRNCPGPITAALPDSKDPKESATRLLDTLEEDLRSGPLKDHGQSTISGSCNHLQHSGVARHRTRVCQELTELVERARVDRESVVQDLVSTGAWKAWSEQLSTLRTTPWKKRAVKQVPRWIDLGDVPPPRR
eukprot:gnl/MRDRNA2_/MRDRNA2_141432_c0_seq1.p1 gnl/MRDRNA2_/MRDRNA2_141432_c0~~gnl/MRDRNA2_/MRDRNA2_141432_c0_seq1.p1  ORF type:complete len:211 (+),score=29.80 gnl/MRDRNA2_/MRDRNA2_141432_c0_seq1:83-715(+)